MAERSIGGSYWASRQDDVGADEWPIDDSGIDLSGDVVLSLPLDVDEGDMVDLSLCEEHGRPGRSWERVVARW